jgi:hemolysin activation/secretion protein
MYPVIMTRQTNFQVHTTANYENVTSWILDGPFYQDRIRSLMGGFYFDTTDSVHGFDTLNVDVTHGFPIFGANDHLLQSRPRGRSKFTIANLNASRLQPFASRFAFYIGLQYQWSANPLLAAEQYSWGGPIYGRGYGPSELVGDRGLGGKAEFRVDTFPDWKFIQAIEFYLFYDAGIVWNLDTLNLLAKQTATSTGFGARVNFIPNYLFGEVYVAKPLTRQDFTLTPPDQNPQQARGFFQLILKF